MLRRAEDAYVDELYEAAPELGATLIGALFPRSYLDPNRAPDDLDPALLDAAALPPGAPAAPGDPRRPRAPRTPGPACRSTTASSRPTKSSRGSSATTRPTTACSTRPATGCTREFGAVWHINCHSMPSNGGRGDARRASTAILCSAIATARPATPRIHRFRRGLLRGLGYDVRINEGYKGVEIVTPAGAPAANRHSLQIEVDRSLYMDQKTLGKTAGFDRLQADLAASSRRSASSCATGSETCLYRLPQDGCTISAILSNSGKADGCSGVAARAGARTIRAGVPRQRDRRRGAAELTAEDLSELGVTSVGHRRKLLDAIAALRTAADAPPSQ